MANPSTFILLALLITLPVFAQLPEDDEIDTSIPGYTHRIYSGILYILPRLS